MSDESMRQKFDSWYASPRGEAQFQLGMHYLGWAFVCFAEGYKQAAQDLGRKEPLSDSERSVVCCKQTKDNPTP